MKEQSKNNLIENLKIGLTATFLIGAIGIPFSLACLGTIAQTYRKATTDYYRGVYQDVQVQKEVGKNSTYLVLQEKGHYAAKDPVIFANLLPDGCVTNIKEWTSYLFGDLAETKLHEFTNPKKLEQVANCATSKVSSLEKWF